MLIGVVIGSGIFRVPSTVAAEVGSAGAAMIVWLVGALVTLCGALSVAGLAAAFPQTGGAYVFLREGYGPLVAFLFGWIKLVVTGPSAFAAVALVFASYTGAFVSLSEREQQLVAAGLLIVLTAINIRSVSWSATIQNLSTGTKVLALAALAGLLFAFGDPGSGALAEAPGWRPASWGGFGVALIAVLWTYTGWVDLSYLAGEVRHPERAFPRAMLAGIAVIVVLYLLINAAYFYVLPVPVIAGSTVVASAAAERVFGAIGASLVAALVMVSALGSLNGSFLSSPRVFFSMAEDGVFFRTVGSVHPRYQTPHVALLLSLGLGLLGVFTKTFEQLAQIFVLGIWPFYALVVGTVFLFRRRSTVPVTLRNIGHPVAPALFLLISAAMLVNGAVQRPAETALSLGILAVGVPAYYGWLALPAQRQRRRDAAS